MECSLFEVTKVATIANCDESMPFKEKDSSVYVCDKVNDDKKEIFPETKEEKMVDAPWKCLICNKVDDQKKKHLQSHASDDGWFWCPSEDCGKCFGSGHQLKRHFGGVHLKIVPKKLITCKICTKKVIPGNYTYHQRVYHSQGSLQCPEKGCHRYGDTFASKVNLDAHMEIHKDLSEKTLQCTFCEKRFYSRTRLGEHRYRYHENHKKHMCDKCNYTCSDLKRLNQHIATHQHDDEKNFSCPICSKLFKTQDLISRHNDRVHRQKKWNKETRRYL